MRADRLVSLALLLQARGRMSARDLATELEVTVRTIYRDISALSSAGIPVVTEPGPNGGCRLVDGYRFPLRGLSADEAESLLILGVPEVLAELGLANEFASARRKVSTAAGLGPAPRTGTGTGTWTGPREAGSGAVREPSLKLVHLDMPRWFHAAERVPELRTLAGAVRLRRRLLLGYRSGGDSREEMREVEPLGLVNKAGTWYLVASAAEGGASGGRLRVYRAGRITAARMLSASFAWPADFDLAAFWDRWSAAFAASRPRLEVRARLSPQALAALPFVFGDTGRQVAETAAAPDQHGWCVVTLAFEDERAAAQRLAGFGGGLEVLSPAGVRDRLVATARELLGRYGQPLP